MLAVIRSTPCSRNQPTSAAAASPANPWPCHGTPTTQATSAWHRPSSRVSVACTVPTAWPSARRRSTQLHQRSSALAGPSTMRSNRARSSARSAGSPPMNSCNRRSASTSTSASASSGTRAVRASRAVVIPRSSGSGHPTGSGAPGRRGERDGQARDRTDRIAGDRRRRERGPAGGRAPARPSPAPRAGPGRRRGSGADRSRTPRARSGDLVTSKRSGSANCASSKLADS